MLQKNTSFTDRLQKKFNIIIGLIGLLFITIFAVHFIILAHEQSLLEAVDKSGRQRMLSQRITLLAHSAMEHLHDHEKGYLANNVTPPLDSLARAIALMRESHDILTTGSDAHDIPAPTDALRHHYFEKDNPLDTQVKTFLNNAGFLYEGILNTIEANDNSIDRATLQKTYIKLEIASRGILLDDLDKAVQIYETEGRRTLDTLKYTQPVLIALTGFLLLIIWLYIFRPMIAKLRFFITSLNHQITDHEKERKRFHRALENALTGIWDWDIKLEYFMMNDVFQTLLGIKYHEDNYFSSEDVFNRIHSDDREGFRQAIQAYLYNSSEQDDRFAYECRLLHEDGHYIWGRFAGKAMLENGARTMKMHGSFEDITEQKNAEIEKNLFMQGIEACGIAFGIINVAHPMRCFRFVSQAFCNMTGHSAETLMNKNMNVFTGPVTSMSDLDRIDYAMSEKQSTSIKMLSYRVDGTSFWNSITLSPVEINDEPSDYFVVTFEDLTESLDREQQEVVRQRNESLGSLAASVAHEINNLLMPMTMAKDILEGELKEDCDPFAQEQLDTISDYALQAKEIVQGILTFSRKETDDLKKVMLYEELNGAIGFIENLLSSKTTLVFQEPDDPDLLLVETMLNSTEMKQIITNLCKNAEDAFENAPGEIIISLSQKTLNNSERTKHNVIASNFVVIHVSDNGSGIPQDIIHKVFEPLFTTKDVGKGTGLGLSVVHGIIRSWGGFVTVDSLEGRGTTFKLYIPIHKKSDDFSDLMDLIHDDIKDDE